MFARATIGFLLLGLLAQAESATQAHAQHNESKKEVRQERREQREERRQHEKEEAQHAVTTLEAAVRSDNTSVQQSFGTLQDMQTDLHTSYDNKTLRLAQVHHWMTAARQSRQAQRARLQHDFETAQQQAHRGGEQLRNVARQMANATGATAGATSALRQQAHAADTAMGSQLELMATHIKNIRKLDREERHDARHHLHKFKSGLRSDMKHHVKATRAAVHSLEKHSKRLEREQRRAGLSERVFEGTEEKNEHTWESSQDRVEDMSDRLSDQIDDISDNMESSLESEMDKQHDANERAEETLRHQYKAVADMAEQARRSMNEANKAQVAATKHSQAEAEHSNSTEAKHSKSSESKGDISLLSAISQASPLACGAAILIGAMAAVVVDRLLPSRQVQTHDGLVGLMA